MLSKLPSLLRNHNPQPDPVLKSKMIVHRSTARKNYLSSLPNETEVQKYLGDGFVINEPLEGVGGDGYWLGKKGDQVFLVAFDCMGHGHLATMMTRVYQEAIEKSIYEHLLDDPATILEDIHAQIEEDFKLKQNLFIGSGADMAVVIVDKRNKQLKYSGAKMDLIEIDGKSVNRMKGGKRSIGVNFELERLYRTIYIPFDEKADNRYFVYSDGATDLFGGPGEKEKKIGYKRLGEMLLNSRQFSLKDQKRAMQSNFSRWSKGGQRLDDLMLIGFSIK